MAEQLGATALTLSGYHVAQEIINYARSNNVTKIILGKPLKRNLSDLLKGTIVDQVVEQSGDIDVHIITPKKNNKMQVEKPAIIKKSLSRYFNSILLVIGISLFGGVIQARLAPTNLAMFYLLGVVVAAIRWGRGPSVFAALLSVLVFDFFFVKPYFTFVVSDTQYIFTFAALLIVGLIISRLTVRTRDQAVDAQAREAQATALYNLSRYLTAAKDISAIVDIVYTHFVQTFHSRVAVFLKEGASLNLQGNPGYPITEHEKAVATWVAQNKQAAGWGTETLSASVAQYVPLKTGDNIFGVLGIKFDYLGERLPLDERRLLETFATQIALAIERVLLVEEARQMQLMREKEIMQTALFDSISHDLKTPLVSIQGSLSDMLENKNLEERSKQAHLETAYEETVRMNRLVNNLLDTARLEAGAFKLSLKPYEVRDLVGTVIKEFEVPLKDRKVTVKISSDLPDVVMDFILMAKVLANIIDNAIKYSPFNLPIDIESAVADDYVEIKVLDRGLGIPKDDLERIFDKFYRVKQPENFEGTGLGLSICKRIVDAHKGKIWPEDRTGGGSIFTIALPLSKGHVHE